jgi:hypothetical protein
MANSRVANMLVEDYLRPAAARAGILSSDRDDYGRSVEDEPRRFGSHNLRHSLASFLVRISQIDAAVLPAREEIRKSRNRGSVHGDFPEIWPLYCDHSVTSADVRLRVGVEMFRIRRQEKNG